MRAVCEGCARHWLGRMGAERLALNSASGWGEGPPPSLRNSHQSLRPVFAVVQLILTLHALDFHLFLTQTNSRTQYSYRIVEIRPHH